MSRSYRYLHYDVFTDHLFGANIHISIGVDGSTINNVRVGGEAVLAGEGTLYA